jgi:hypothetical protein
VSLYASAPEVAAIATDLINTVERHNNLAQVRVDYLFIDTAPKSKGRTILGRARKLGGLPAFLTGSSHPRFEDQRFREPDPFFVVEISHDFWAHELNDAQKRALVDHELCHCRVTTDELTREIKSLSIVGHDVEEFACVVQRHGLWDTGLTTLGQAMTEQLAFEIDHITTNPPDDADEQPS